MTTIRRGTDWTDKHIRAFWDHFSANQHKSAQYFSRLVARELVALLRLHGALRGRFLDYGCGPGFLLEKVIEHPVQCWGLDFSADSVRAADERLRGRPNWHGATLISAVPSPYEAASFDTVTCIETIEHLPDHHLATTFLELRRLVAPGGSVLVTTPNAENLDANMVFCPFCDSVFHPVQHLRSWTEDSLRSALHAAGFRDVTTHAIDLVELQRPSIGQRRFWNPRVLPRTVRARAAAMLDGVLRPAPGRSRELRALSRPGPHLYAIAKP